MVIVSLGLVIFYELCYVFVGVDNYCYMLIFYLFDEIGYMVYEVGFVVVDV